MEHQSIVRENRKNKTAKVAKMMIMMVLAVVVVNVLMYLSTMITGKTIEHGIMMELAIPALCAFMMI